MAMALSTCKTGLFAEMLPPARVLRLPELSVMLCPAFRLMLPDSVCTEPESIVRLPDIAVAEMPPLPVAPVPSEISWPACKLMLSIAV